MAGHVPLPSFPAKQKDSPRLTCGTVEQREAGENNPLTTISRWMHSTASALLSMNTSKTYSNTSVYIFKFVPRDVTIAETFVNRSAITNCYEMSGKTTNHYGMSGKKL